MRTRLSLPIPPTLRALRAILGVLWAPVLAAVSPGGELVTVRPVELAGPLRNPLMGFRPDLGGWRNYPYPTVVRHYIKWNEIENSAADSVQKIRDFCNQKWAGLPAANIRVIPRVYIDWDRNPGNENWPSDLTPGDWTSSAFKQRVVRLVERLGEVWDNDPRVAWVQTGLIGYWGEQESPVGISQDGWAKRLGDAYTAAFKNKMLIVRNMGDWPGYEMGVYWDSFGHPQQPNAKTSILNFNAQGRYLSRVIEGEVAYDWGQDAFDPLYGGEPTLTLNDSAFTDRMIDVIRELHGSALGWIASYKLDGSLGTNPDNVRANAARMQAAFGYRLSITSFSCSSRVEPGATLEVRATVANLGAAPFYEKWPLAVVLIDETSRRIVWTSVLPEVDVRTWRPGSSYTATTRTYEVAAAEHTLSASLPLPGTFPAGRYLVGLSILEPVSGSPGILFAVPNFFKESQSQPLCRIGVGTDAGAHMLDAVRFDDPVGDDRRFYAVALPEVPTVATTRTDGALTLAVATGGPAWAGFQWRRNGVAIPGATSSQYTLPSFQSYHAGTYAVTVTAGGVSATSTGTVVEAPPQTSSNSRLLNTSTRAFCGSGADVLISGFVVSNEGPRTFLIRAVGPSLAGPPFNVPGALADPVLRIFNSAGGALLTNDTWGENGDAASIRAATAAVGAFPLRDSSRDAALVVTLPPGGYTAQVSGAEGATGVALVELYLVP